MIHSHSNSHSHSLFASHFHFSCHFSSFYEVWLLGFLEVRRKTWATEINLDQDSSIEKFDSGSMNGGNFKKRIVFMIGLVDITLFSAIFI